MCVCVSVCLSYMWESEGSIAAGGGCEGLGGGEVAEGGGIKR